MTIEIKGVVSQSEVEFETRPIVSGYPTEPQAAGEQAAGEDEWTQPEWKMLSLLLSYPGHSDYRDMLHEVKEWATELHLGATGAGRLATGGTLTATDTENPAAAERQHFTVGGTLTRSITENQAVAVIENLVLVVNDLLAYDQTELVAQYVQQFDFQSKTCLYLTAHELGDSRKRGLALVALRRMLADAGLYERSLVDPGERIELDGQPEAAGGQAELPDYIPLLFEFLAARPEDFDSADIEIRLARVCRTIYDALPEQSVYRTIFENALSLLPERQGSEKGFVFATDQKADLEELPYPLFYD